MSHTSSASASAASDETASAASPAASAAASAAGSDGAAPAADEWSSLRPLLSRRGPWCTADFAPDEEDPLDVVQNSTRVLVVGAGGLGCEILKDLALSGFTDIHVIDMDTVDVSNLNRQAHTKAIQDFSPKWFAQFDLVIAGLDNVEARQWLNNTLVQLVQFDDKGQPDIDTVIPLIDGGTEGFQGQARVFLPRITSCFECSLASMPPQTGFAVSDSAQAKRPRSMQQRCTIRNVPRIAEHCIVYALKVEWPLLTSFTSVDDFVLSDRRDDSAAGSGGPGGDDEMDGAGSVSLDKDNVQHMTWLYNRSLARAARFGITGVTYNLTMQVVKNVIPAIASTNALISAACTAEALKYRTGCAPTLNNYFMYIGASQTGVNTETIEYRRNPECAVCQPPLFLRNVDPMTTLQQLIQRMQTERGLSSPSVSLGGTFLYLSTLHNDYANNLDKCLGELIESGQMLVVNDKGGKTIKLVVFLEGM